VGREFPRIPNSDLTLVVAALVTGVFSALGQMSVTLGVRDVTGLVALRALSAHGENGIRESFLH